MKYLGIIGALFVLFALTSCFSKQQNEELSAQQNQTQILVEQENSQNTEQNTREPENSLMIEQKEDDIMIDKSEQNQESDTMMEQEDSMKEETSIESEMQVTAELNSGEYTPYDTSLIGARDNTVIFFGADWCPGCVQADTNLMSEEIPEGLTILKADFDSDLELRKKYGVVAQHTFVVVDENGEEIKKWVGGYSADDIIEKL